MKTDGKNQFGQPGFQVWLFLLCLLLFNWPILSIIPPARQDWLYGYLFSVWGMIIFLLFLVSRSLGDDDA
ncbi:MAG: hypothetical protein ACM3YO_03105 [Bacteroidota bacterium]